MYLHIYIYVCGVCEFVALSSQIVTHKVNRRRKTCADMQRKTRAMRPPRTEMRHNEYPLYGGGDVVEPQRLLAKKLVSRAAEAFKKLA